MATKSRRKSKQWYYAGTIPYHQLFTTLARLRHEGHGAEAFNIWNTNQYKVFTTSEGFSLK